MSLAVRVTPAVAAAQAAAPIPSCRAPGALLPTAQRVFHAAARAVPARRGGQAGAGRDLGVPRPGPRARGLRGEGDGAWRGVRAPPRQPPTDKTMTAAVVVAAAASSAVAVAAAASSAAGAGAGPGTGTPASTQL